ncbi:MAG: heparinase II/III family protein [Clostridiales bacterium]|nr:heparinase II/III family protein [Clostridiales bacterium]
MNDYGPMLSDDKFFNECLNYNIPNMEKVKRFAAVKNFPEARGAFAEHIRTSLNPEVFFSIPYEEPENIYKYSDESDYDACKRVRQHIMISVGMPFDFGEDGSVDWHFNPTENDFREWTWQLNRHNELKMLAHEYRRTGEAWLAETAAELFASWVKQALCPESCSEYQTQSFRTIECGIRMGANWPYALFSFYQSEAFTDDILVDWYKSVWEQGNRLSKNSTHGNWLLMEMNGLAHIGILYPEFAQSGQWLTQALSNMEQELDRQFYPDGFQYELSTNYHEVALNNYIRLINCATTFDVPIPENMLKRIADACELEIKLMMPDGRLPDINDGERLCVRTLLSEKSHLFPHNQAIQSVLGKRSFDLPYQSVALPYSGILVMRNGWGEKDTWALFDAGPFGRGHQHEDKLSVLLYSDGKFLVTEAGNYAYDSSPMRKYAVSSAAHNTVLVDGCGQNRRKHYKWNEEDIKVPSNLNSETGVDWDCGEGNYTEGYGNDCQINVTHERKVFFRKTSMRGVRNHI